MAPRKSDKNWKRRRIFRLMYLSFRLHVNWSCLPISLHVSFLLNLVNKEICFALSVFSIYISSLCLIYQALLFFSCVSFEKKKFSFNIYISIFLYVNSNVWNKVSFFLFNFSCVPLLLLKNVNSAQKTKCLIESS